MNSNRESSVIWRQAVQFDSAGGWSHDCQFMDQMGFPYLLATGLGTPVDDAVTRVRLRDPGAYQLWVRCKDWYPTHSPGKFQVTLNGQPSETVFGEADNPEWQWFDGGRFSLPAGEVEIRLRDLTGWWARCDAVVLSSLEDFRPSDDLEALWRQRIEFGAVTGSIEQPGPYDVVVVGGGLAGVTAALAASRHGCRVALLQDRPVLGGNTSSEVCVPAMGDETRQPWDPRETGLIEEFDPQTTGKSGWSTNLETVVRAEENLDLFLNLRTTQVQMKERTIRAVEGMNTLTGQRYCFEGQLYIDCTGDATVGYAAGADFRQGREAKREFNESLAIDEADAHTMGSTLFGGRVEKLSEPAPFDTPDWAYQWKSPEDFEQRPTAGVWSTGRLPDHFTNLEKGDGRPPESAMGPVGCWFVESGGMEDTINDAERIRDELFRICVGVWGYVKNHDPVYRIANKNRRLAWLNHVAGKRESRRLMGDYVMTQRDYTERIVHEDTIAYGGWTIDDHHPRGYFTPGPSAYHAYLQKVSIPYRCLYSRNVSNLMMAGRNVSATHVGFSGIRVMRTCCLMGQAAGTAAAIAVEEDTTPRGVYEARLDRLQQTLLKDGAYLLATPNRDANDVARAARVSASSFAVGNDWSWLVTPISKWGVIHPVDTRRAVMFRATTRKLESLALALRSRSSEPVCARLSLRRATEFGDFSSGENIAIAESVLPPHTSGWFDFALTAELCPNEFYYLVLERAAGLEWELYEHHPPDTLRAYDGPGWGVLWGCYKFRLTPGGEPRPSRSAIENERYEFLPENVVNGWSRAVEGAPNSWAPDPRLPLPQHVELRFVKPTRLNTLHVTFQLQSLAPSAYSLAARLADNWREILQVENNRRRRRVHSFDTVETDAVRLILKRRAARQKCPLVPVCEIRLYRE